jgi:hypothetical protein
VVDAKVIIGKMLFVQIYVFFNEALKTLQAAVIGAIDRKVAAGRNA